MGVCSRLSAGGTGDGHKHGEDVDKVFERQNIFSQKYYILEG
jgi:hypothetical protein